MERRRILDLYRRGDASVLVTLIRVEGSSYRQPGARLLIAANGDYAGAISGGCLEAEVLRKAQWKVRHGAVVERYSTLFEDTAEIPYGLGCGGTVDLLFEPADASECGGLMDAMEATLHGEGRRVITQLPEDGGAIRRCILDPQGEHLFRSASGVVDTAKPCFDETLDPPQRLVLFGAGDDAQPMVRLAGMLGWRTAVVDSRVQWAKRERFPEVDIVAAQMTSLEIAIEDAVVVMSHSYEQDRTWLTEALRAEPRYLGLLGARHRSALLLTEVAEALQWPMERVCASVFAPIGLDLGGDGAEAIALATIAEIQASIGGKLGSSRRMTPSLVASLLAQGSNARYLQNQCAL